MAAEKCCKNCMWGFTNPLNKNETKCMDMDNCIYLTTFHSDEQRECFGEYKQKNHQDEND